MRLRILTLWICVLACGLALTSPELASQVRYRPTEPGPWRPWSFTAIASARQSRGATAADVQAWQARLQELGAIVKGAPAVAQPIGFAGLLSGHLAGYGPPEPGQPTGKVLPLSGALSFYAFPLIEFMRNGRLVNEDMRGGETAGVHFTINQIDQSAFSPQRPGEWSGEEAIGFTQPKPGQPYAGLARLDDAFVLTRHDRPLWVPLPLDGALQPVVTQRRELFENRRDNYARESKAFEAWRTPEARARRRADWQKAAATLPDGQAFLANMEKSDVDIEKMNRERYAPGGTEERGVKEAEQALQEVQQLLAGYSPEQRSGPSCYDARAASLRAKFRPLTGAPSSCVPLVRTNWAYFDPTLPRSAPQVLMVTMFDRCLRPESLRETSPGGCETNRRLLQSMDWNAVRAWLNR